jgi:hypothetical protein
MANESKQPSVHITDEMISERAYQVWQTRGCPQGDGSTDWEIAKQQLERESRGALGSLRRIIARLRSRAA